MYSTIRPKIGTCALCTDDKKKPLTKGLCQQHYWESVRMRSAQRLQAREIISEDGLPELIEEADAVFSRYVRLAAADERGLVHCYICGTPVRWQDAQAMHFISRSCMFLRWDLRNVKAGDKGCNEIKGGNLILFAKRLNEDQPGITEILMEESRIVYKPTREEVKAIVNEYSLKIKNLLKEKV